MNNPTENKVRLIGHVGADPKIKYLDPLICSAQISLATNAEGAINEKGIMVRGMVTDWHAVLCYGKLAEEVDKTIGTGDLIEVEGRLTYLQIGMGHQKRHKAVVLASTISMIKKKERESKTTTPKENIHNPYGEYLDTLSQDPDSLPF